MQTEPVKPRYAVKPGTADFGVSDEGATASITQPPLLKTIVLVSGICVMAIQMTASRLVQPFFGSSQLIWANLIGFTMTCLALGYFLGGRLGDRYPRVTALYLLMGVATLLTLLIPVISNPVLSLTRDLSDKLPAGQFIGSLLGIALIFGLPMVLFACVSPYAVRLLLRDPHGAGKTAGTLSSLNTIGSIFGTFVPVFVIIPTLGARATILIFGGILLIAAAVAYFVARSQGEPAFPTAVPATKTASAASATDTGKIATPFLLPIVFVCGMAVMAMEMGASRLIQPYFGDSLLIWACLIGFIIIYLATGYFVGGRLGDRYPQTSFLYTLTGIAAVAIGVVPLLSKPILDLAQSAFKSINGGLFFGALFGIIILLAVPVILLGCVSPFAIRLLMNNVSNAGKTAGKVSSVSTIGSILGTFLPVLVLIPTIGTRNTFYLFSITLLAFSTVGLWIVNRKNVPLFGGALALVLIAAFVLNFGIKTAPYGKLLYEKESSYNYIQVVERDQTAGDQAGQIDLVLNEGRAVHSIYNPKKILTGGPWDFYMIAPFFNKGQSEKEVKAMMMIGLGAGTVPKQLSKAYGSQVQVDGIEIDPAIIEAGRKYFDMNEPNLNAIAQDGRYGLLASQKKYDIIGMDAYKQPYIPFHLTTKEFFQEVRDHLTPNGVAVVNAGSPAVNGKIDYRLAEALAHTMKQVYPNVFMINLLGISGYYNTIIVATNQPSDIASFKRKIEQEVTNPLIKEVGAKAIAGGNIREWSGQSENGQALPPVLTDDLAPVERIIDQVIIDYVTGGGK